MSLVIYTTTKQGKLMVIYVVMINDTDEGKRVVILGDVQAMCSAPQSRHHLVGGSFIAGIVVVKVVGGGSDGSGGGIKLLCSVHTCTYVMSFSLSLSLPPSPFLHLTTSCTSSSSSGTSSTFSG